MTRKLDDLELEAKFLIRDNDARFGGGFDLVMEGEGIEVIKDSDLGSPGELAHRTPERKYPA